MQRILRACLRSQELVYSSYIEDFVLNDARLHGHALISERELYTTVCFTGA